MLAFTFSTEIALIGAITGLAYAVLAAGLLLLYRATRIINFAHGEIGALGAAVLAKLVLDEGWNFFAALAAVVAVGGLIGAAIELGIVRRLFAAPRLILLVATIGVSQLLLVGQFLLPGVNTISRYPTPIDRSLRVGDVVLRGEHFMVIVFVPALIAALAYFLNRTPYGIAIRAVAENAERAELTGISAKRVSTSVWVLAGVLSTVTAVLINPLRGAIVGSVSVALGPGLLLRSLAATLVGRMESLPLTLAGGVAIGVIEAVLFVNISNPGFVDFVLFLAVLGLVVARGHGSDTEEAGSWSLTPKVRPVPARLRELWWVRHLPVIAVGTGLVVALGIPVFVGSASKLFLVSRVFLFAMIALSVTVLTGWAGQLSLGQFAFVGLGSMVTASLHSRGMPFGIAVLYATVAGVFAAIAVGAPALRIRGLFLSVTTLAFAIASHSYLLSHSLLTNTNLVFLPRGKWGFVDLGSHRVFYLLCLAALVATALATARLRRSGVGRAIIAVRDNERQAAAFTVSPTWAKLTAFAVAGGLAALAGALLAGLRVQFAADGFGPDESLRVVAMTIIGGLGSVAGAILGAIYVIGLPALIEDSVEVRLLTTSVGLLFLLLYIPGGLTQVVYTARDALLRVVDRRRGDAIPVAPGAPRAGQPSPAGEAAVTIAVARRPGAQHGGSNGHLALRADGVTVRFGGLVALDRVTIEARPGETVGLIGTNGAGKSTLMNVLSGFLAPAEGRIELLGDDVTDLAPHLRARLGMARLFQDARLFPDLTVRESIGVALEARERTELLPSLLAVAPSRLAEARKAADVDELIAFLGLGRYADSFASDLSTGTRRIAELACLLALQAPVLLLDEPTAGVAQRETEAFGPLIQRVRAELDATLLIIEHDMPLVFSLSDRVYCLGSGRVIAEGRPDEVRADAAVIASYLGTDERAIRRSDVSSAAADPAVWGGR